jgi:hypothetical protein
VTERRTPAWMLDSDRTPPARPPSVATLLLWADDAMADARRCDALELKAAELAAEFRALADAFRAWEHSPPDVTLRNGAYARLIDLREQMKGLKA